MYLHFIGESSKYVLVGVGIILKMPLPRALQISFNRFHFPKCLLYNVYLPVTDSSIKNHQILVILILVKNV